MGGAKKDFLNQTKRKFYAEIKSYQKQLKPTKEIQGFATAPIVGEKNYPFLATHNISNEEKNSSFFETGKLVKKSYDEILPLKAKSILGSTQKNYIKKPQSRIVEELRDVYKSKKAIEFESNFSKEIKFDKILTSKVAGVMGAKNELVDVRGVENTSTSKNIEKFVEDDIKAKQAIISLYEKGVNEHQIINLLALGSFGISYQRKMVPTKWAISAYDQTIDNHLAKKILSYKLIENYEIYHDFDKGNDFVIILIPDNYSAEVIETWDMDTMDTSGFSGKWKTNKKTIVEQDYVGASNKLKTKEPQCAGGYWASKCGVNEFLHARKKQCAYISIRYIENYDIPLGVVFVRECARKALSKNPIFKSSNKVEFEIFLKQNYPKHYVRYLNAYTLKKLKIERKISEFF